MSTFIGKPPGLETPSLDPVKIPVNFGESPGLESSQSHEPPSVYNLDEPKLVEFGPTPESQEVGSQLAAVSQSQDLHSLFATGLQISSQPADPRSYSMHIDEPEVVTSQASCAELNYSQTFTSTPEDWPANAAAMQQDCADPRQAEVPALYAGQPSMTQAQDGSFWNPYNSGNPDTAAGPCSAFLGSYASNGFPTFSSPALFSHAPGFDVGCASGWSPHALQAYSTSKAPTAPAKLPKGKRTRPLVQPAQDKKRRPPPAANEERAVPEASEEDWKRRIEHRSNAIDYIRTTNQYQRFKQDIEQGIDKEGKTRPKTPDPEDRTVSKREWEKSVQRWRVDLQAW